MSKHRDPSLGVHLLGTITRGMYSNPLHSIREYIQNAYDSIRDARRHGLLNPEDGIVKIMVDTNARTLKIRDNGMGLDPEAAVVRLVDLGSSPKATSAEGSNENAGFRGIGRMAGISYCNNLRFETSDGKGRKTIVTFDAKAINRLTDVGQKPTTIIKAINDNCQADEVADPSSEHYLEVTLEGLKSDSVFLSPDHLCDYLGQVGPVSFDPRQWTFSDRIRSIATNAGQDKSKEHIAIKICNSDGQIIKDVRRPHMDKFRSGGRSDRQVSVTTVEPLPLIGEISSGYWGWLAVHKWEKQLTDAPFAGLRVRMHNIEIGDHKLVRELFTSPNLSTWCFGEIHITDYSITPNAQRDDFQESREWEAIKTRIRDDVTELEKRIRNESTARNRSTEILLKKADKKISETKKVFEAGIESKEEQDKLVEGLRVQEEKLDDAIRQKKRTEEDKQRLKKKSEEIQNEINNLKTVKRTHTDEAMSHLDRQTRRVVKKIFSILQQELDESVFFSLQRKINEAIQPGQNR